MNAPIAIGIIGAVLAATLALGAFGVRRIAMDPEQFIVGGRSFGALFLWLLLAGEIYQKRRKDAAYAKGNFCFDRVIRGWRGLPMVDLRRTT